MLTPTHHKHTKDAKQNLKIEKGKQTKALTKGRADLSVEVLETVEQIRVLFGEMTSTLVYNIEVFFPILFWYAYAFVFVQGVRGQPGAVSSASI